MALLRALYWLLALVIVAVAIIVAVANRHLVALSFDPFPFMVTVPLYVIIFASVLVGLLLGGIAATLSGVARRRRARTVR